eukprot:6862437-Prymnesium_polylepis.1
MARHTHPIGFITIAHHLLLCTLTLGVQCKPNKRTGNFPLTVDAVTAIRPLARPNVLRRHIFPVGRV